MVPSLLQRGEDGRGTALCRWISGKAIAIASTSRYSNIWSSYIPINHTRQIQIIERELYYLEVFRTERGRVSTEEMEKSSSVTIANAKNFIKKVFEEIESNGDSYKRYPELEKGIEIDVEKYLCSVCGLEDAPRNDILFCDKAGCNRAYHQKCLDPPILSLASLEDDDDWFCPICDCIEDCLEMVNEAFETSYTQWKHIFPEIESSQSYMTLEGSDDEEDESYAPSVDDDSVNVFAHNRGSDDSSSEASENSSNDENLSAVDEEELHYLLRESGGGEVDQRIRRRSKPELVDVLSQFDAPSNLVSHHVAKSIKGYLLRGQVIGYTPLNPDSSSTTQPTSSDPDVPPGWDGVWTIQYEYERNPCQVTFPQLKTALELCREYNKKIQTQDESKKRNLDVRYIVAIRSVFLSNNLIELGARGTCRANGRKACSARY